MQVRKLYYEDCHRTEFSAVVTGCVRGEKGWLVTLDATAFYPEGGGQGCDLGSLGGAHVLDVQERDDTVIHLCDKPLTPGQTVNGRVDWARRFDLMQQHTGEHILSGLIHAKFGYHNVGFHMGAEVTEVDFDGPISMDALAQLEAQANRAVWENLPVQCWYPGEAELAALPYRSKKALMPPVRIVRIPGYDTCACCGVHTAFTGEVGLVKILSCVKFHQGVRLEMVCGKRAYDYLSRVYEQNRQVSQLFSAKIPETAAAAKRVSEQLAAEKFRAVGLEKRLFDTIAQGLSGVGDVVRFENGLSGAAIRELADKIASSCGGTAAVFSGSDENGYSFCLISKTADVKALGTAAAQALNGRGGGKAGVFQGSVRAAEEEIRRFFAKSLTVTDGMFCYLPQF